MSVPAYPAYKDSRVEWIGMIPTGWEVKPLKRVTTLKTQRADERVFAVALESIESWSGRFIEAEGIYEGYGIAFDAGDILFGKLRPYLAKAWLADRSGEAVGDFHVLSCNAHNRPEFIHKIVLSREVISLIDGSTFGAKMPRASWDFIGMLPVPIPPPTEQSAIAAFLDRETGKIDALVAEQERLMALLKEKRQAVISQAVTKGLAPNAPMKPSGAEWLGDVPAHWDVLAVWLIFELGRGRVISHEEIHNNLGDYPVYSSQTENDGEMGHINTFDFDGDYLTWTTDGAHAGTVFRRSGKFNCTNVCGTMRLKADVHDLDYLCHAVSSCTAAYVRQDINPKLMNNVMSKIRIPTPPLAEQIQIAALTRGETTKIDTLTAEAARVIALLQERRAALISAAITGKIDVRGLAARVEEAA